MLRLPCFHPDGRFAEWLELDPKVFGGRVHRIALKTAVLAYEANQRRGTHSTLERSQVAGARRKPWAQKHTGRARAGARQSPIWSGGGIVHGPKPRDYSTAVPRKVRHLARQSALLARAQDGGLAVIADFVLPDPPKTKALASVLKKIDPRATWLLGTPKAHPALHRASRNLPRVDYRPVHDWSSHEILRVRRLLVTRAGLDALVATSAAQRSA